MTNKLTCGSLFTGVGGLDQGFEEAGHFNIVWQAETDPYCLDVLNHHYPNVCQFGDVKNVTKEKSEQHTGSSSVDVIFGGSPCTGLSVAGRRGGLRDERSGLFYQFLRVVHELRPLWFVWENVPGVLTSGPTDQLTGRKRKGLDFAIVLSGFAGGLLAIPEGGWRNAGVVNGYAYNLAWRTLDSQYWGVPQRRRRVFIVGGLRAAGLHPAEILFEPSGYAWNTPPRRKTRADSAPGTGADAQLFRADTAQTPAPDADQHSETAQAATDTYPRITGTLAASGAGTQRPAGQANETDFVIVQNYRVTGNGKRFIEDESAAPVMPLNNTNILTQTHRAYGFTGFVEDDVADTLKTTTGRQVSNLVTYAIKTDNTKSNGMGVLEGGAKDAIVYEYGARRLTPRETERLQGWPDDHTAHGESGKTISDTQRYKMTGNGVTSTVAKWIAERLHAAHQRQYKGRPPK